MRKQIITLLLFICLSFLLSCNNTEVNSFNIANEKQLIEKTIRNNIGWAKNKDLSLLYSTVANDSTYLEVDPEERIVYGFDEFKKK